MPVSGQATGVSFLPPPYEFQGLNKGSWASWKVSFPAEISPLSWWLLTLFNLDIHFSVEF